MLVSELLWLINGKVEDSAVEDFFHPLNGTEHRYPPSLTTRDRELVSVLEVSIEPRPWMARIGPADLNPSLYRGLGVYMITSHLCEMHIYVLFSFQQFLLHNWSNQLKEGIIETFLCNLFNL